MAVNRSKAVSHAVSKKKRINIKRTSPLNHVPKKSNIASRKSRRSNSQTSSPISGRKYSTCSESGNVVSQESVEDTIPQEEEELNELEKNRIFFAKVQQRLNQNSDDVSFNDDESILDGDEENKTPQDNPDSEESEDESQLMSVQETEDVLDEEGEEESNLDSPPRNHDSVVSSLTQGTNHRHNKRRYDDLLLMLEEKEKTIKKLSLQVNGDELNALLDFSCSQEKTVVETAKKFIFPCQQFLRNQDVLNDFTSRSSVGKVFMDKMEIPISQRRAFWFTYKNSVRKAIKQQRCIVHNALKEKFMRK